MTLLRVTRAGYLPLSADGRAFLLCCLECPCIPDGRAGKGKARPAAWRGRDNRVEGVNLGGNRAPARGRNRNSRLEPTPTAALAGFLGPAGMAGGSTSLGNCQGWGERALAWRSPALSISHKETGELPASHNPSFCLSETEAKPEVTNEGLSVSYLLKKRVRVPMFRIRNKEE